MSGDETFRESRLYGNLADAALGERRFRPFATGDARWRDRAARRRRATLRPLPQVMFGLGAIAAALFAFAALGGAQDNLFAPAPALGEVEHWLVWRDWRGF